MAVDGFHQHRVARAADFQGDQGVAAAFGMDRGLQAFLIEGQGLRRLVVAVNHRGHFAVAAQRSHKSFRGQFTFFCFEDDFAHNTISLG